MMSPDGEKCRRCGQPYYVEPDYIPSVRVHVDYSEEVWCERCLNATPDKEVARCWCCDAWMFKACGVYDEETGTWSCPNCLDELVDMQRELQWYEWRRRQPP